MNREDILSARERFGDLTRKPADASASSTTTKSYQGQGAVSVKERKLKMAQNLGVKLVPSFIGPGLPMLTKSENRESNSNPGSPNHQVTMNKKKDGSRHGDKQKAVPQASVQHEQVKRVESSPSRSHKVSSPVAAQRQLGNAQHTSAAHGKSEIEGGSGSHELKSSGSAVTDNHAAHPPKSPAPGKMKFSTHRKKGKVSSDYETAVVETTTKSEKSGSRFKLKLPFGKVKEAKTKIENVEKDKTQKRPTPKPRKGPKQHWSPPREPAPPPPSEPAPPPPANTQVQQTTSPYHQGTNSSKHAHDERPPSPKVPPPGPATYPQLQPYTAIGSLSQTHSVNSSKFLAGTPVEEYLIPVKSHPSLDSPDDDDRPPSPKVPPPGPAITYPKLQPLLSNGHRAAKHTSSHRLAASGLSKSLDTVFDEYIGMTPSSSTSKPLSAKRSPSKPSPAKPPRPAEFTSSLKEDDRPPSPKVPPPGPMTYPNIPPSSTPTSSITKSTAATVSSTSMSLFDEYIGMAPSPTKSSRLPLGSRESKRPPSPKLPPPGGPVTHPQVQALSATAQSTRLSAAFDARPTAGDTSMSLDSILEQFSMMSGSQIGVSMF